MAFRPLDQESELYRAAYASIPARLRNQVQGVFRLDLLFGADWLGIGSGKERQHFGRRYRKSILNGEIAYVTVDHQQPYQPRGNEARFIYHPERHV